MSVLEDVADPGAILSGILSFSEGLIKTVGPEVDKAEKALKERLASVGADVNASLDGLDPGLGQSKYDFTQRIFPYDLGDPGYNGHYMVININVSNYSQFSGLISSPFGTILPETKLPNELSKVDALRSSIDQLYSTGGKPLGVGYYAPRQTRRIAESIALYMPNSVAFTSSNEHQDISLTSMIEGGIRMVPGIGPLLSGPIDIAKNVLNSLHSPINPRTEVIFSNTNLREFQFDFLFAPTNVVESRNLEQIIRTLRFHAAPEFNGLTWNLSALKSLLWTPPSEFDITFYNRGVENTFMPRINTCVCKQISVNYAPTGIYSTFSNGYPVQVAVQMVFHETEVVSKQRVLEGF